MNRLLLLSLLLTNLAWAAWCLSRPVPLPRATSAANGDPDPSVRRGSPVDSLATATHAVPSRSESIPTLQPASPSPAPLRWSALESDDYPQYIANLRAVGCPEQTIADLVNADVRALYRERRRARLATASRGFWDLSFHAGLEESQTRDLDAEEEAVLRGLLGTRAQPRTDDAIREIPACLRVPPGLESRAARLESVTQGFDEELGRFFETTRDREPSDTEFAELTRLMEARRDALSRELLPEESLELELRNSAAADELRSALDGLEVGEAEFRALFGAQQERVKAGGLLDGTDPEASRQLTERFERQALEILGSDRYQRFQQAVGGGAEPQTTVPQLGEG